MGQVFVALATFDDDVSWGGGGAFEFITSPMITVLKSAYGQ